MSESYRFFVKFYRRSCQVFLHNAPPAKIFMGDTGSLSLGGSIASVAIIVKHEIVLAIVGGLFVLKRFQ